MGDSVGDCEGALVGDSVGDTDGAAVVGTKVGDSVGVVLGSDEGSTAATHRPLSENTYDTPSMRVSSVDRSVLDVRMKSRTTSLIKS